MMVFQVVVASVELEKLAYREEIVATAWMKADVQFITPPLPARFVKFVSARFRLCKIPCFADYHKN